MNARNCITHHYACDCREAKFAAIEAERDALRAAAPNPEKSNGDEMSVSIKHILQLGKYDHIITAYAKRCAGPGWTNAPLWVVIRNHVDGTVREECIQPDELTSAMRHLYDVAEAAHSSMMSALDSAIR